VAKIGSFSHDPHLFYGSKENQKADKLLKRCRTKCDE